MPSICCNATKPLTPTEFRVFSLRCCCGAQCIVPNVDRPSIDVSYEDERMSAQTFAWILFLTYAVATAALALRGARRTKTMAGFAIGNQDMSPSLVGITFAASMASTATFVINPGFVYTYGLSALIAFTLPMIVGMFLGLCLLSKRFRTVGDKVGAITLPSWLGSRFKSRRLAVYFSFVTLLNLFYVVLIVVGAAYVMTGVLGLSYKVSVVVVVCFVFAYTMVGGSYAHAYTNGLQGVLMAIISVIVFVSGFVLLEGGLSENLAALRAEDPYFLSVTHPESPFFQSAFEVIICSFIMGFAVVTQPHLLTKTLYLRSSKDMGKFIAIGGGTFVVFSLVFFGGFYARVLYPNIAVQDAVMATFFANAFPAAMSILISVVVLAAAMSTLDGLLVALSAIVSHDLVRHVIPEETADRLGKERMSKLSLNLSRIVLIVFGLIALIVALNPPSLVGIFGAVGTYGVLCAAAVVVVIGVYTSHVPRWVLWSVVIIGPILHFILFLLEVSANPAVTAVWGILGSLVPVTVWIGSTKLRRFFRPTFDSDSKIVSNGGSV